MNVPTLPSSSLEPRPLSSERWLLIAATLVSAALWFIPGAQIALYPVRLFVTLIHESGHAVMTILTGGAVQSMAIHSDGSGVTMSLGGMPFFVYMAGYLGTTAFGAFSLHLSRRAGKGRLGLIFLGAVTLIATGLWLRPWGAGLFGFVAGVLIGVAMLAGGRSLSDRAAAFATSFLAVQLCLNALWDIRTLIWLTTNTDAGNDAVFMARTFGLTPWFWALLWAAGAAAILAVSLRAFWRSSR